MRGAGDFEQRLQVGGYAKVLPAVKHSRPPALVDLDFVEAA